MATTNFCISAYPFLQMYCAACLYLMCCGHVLHFEFQKYMLVIQFQKSGRHGICHHREDAGNCTVLELSRNSTGRPLQNNQANHWNGEGTCTFRVSGLWKSFYAWFRALWVSPLSTPSDLDPAGFFCIGLSCSGFVWSEDLNRLPQPVAH